MKKSLKVSSNPVYYINTLISFLDHEDNNPSFISTKLDTYVMAVDENEIMINS